MSDPKIILYENSDFKGAVRELTVDCANMNVLGFNDRVSSIKVIGSVWVGYKDYDYNGRQFILEEGNYPTPGAWSGSHDELSSLRKLSLDIGASPSITLYQNSNYGERTVSYSIGINNLRYYGFNDEVSSIKVKSGIWVLYKDYEYSGRQFVVTEGNYPDPANWHGSHDEISSLRPVREPHFPTELLSMTFDVESALMNTTPEALVNLKDKNDTSLDQHASWSASQSVSTTHTYEWHWDNTTAVSVETEFKTGVPFISEGKVKLSVTNTFSIGENRGETNTQSDTWNFEVPSVVKAGTQLHLQVTVQQGKIDVPFKAVLKKGNKVWEERGMFKGTNSFNLVIDRKESPL